MKLTEEQRIKRNEAQKRWRLAHPEKAKNLVENARQKREEYYKKQLSIAYFRRKKEDLEGLRKIQHKAHANYIKNHPKYWLEHYKKNRKARIASYQKHRKTHLEQVKHTVKMSKAKAKGYKGSYTLQEWSDLKKKYKFTCPKCKQKEPKIILTADHIIPLKQGGTNYIINIQPLCRPCNASKLDKTIKY